jgi:hypothetical protein
MSAVAVDPPKIPSQGADPRSAMAAPQGAVLNFSDSIMIATENSPIPALHIDAVASGTGSSDLACSSGESGAN